MLFTHYINIITIKTGKPAKLFSLPRSSTITIVHFLLFMAPHSGEVATRKDLSACEMYRVKILLLINPSLNSCNRYCHI